MSRKDNKNKVLRKGESQRKDGTYQYRWTDNNGKRQMVYARTLDELRKKEDSIQRDILNNITYSNITLNEVYEEWISNKQGIREVSRKNYEKLYNNHIRNSIGNMKVRDIKKSTVSKLYFSLLKDKNLKHSSIACVNRVVMMILKYCVAENYILKNPAEGAFAELPTTNKNKKQPLTKEQQKVFLDFLQSNYPQFYRLFGFIANTGLRYGEVAVLRWCDVDFDNNTISINHSLSKNKIVSCKTSNSIRELPLTKQARQILLEEHQNAKRCTQVIDDYTDFIFLTRNGTFYQNATMNIHLNKLIQKCNKQYNANLPKLSVHMLRHCFATRAFESEMDLKTVSKYLGHSNINITANVYVHLTKDHTIKQIDKLDSYLDS
ncbi:MAG: site-specific integrase [Oscillospiraceae bacterium]|nr:site-specific integrase [Oscillospiraceae bacterium]